MKLDEIDIRILGILQDNARIPMQELAHKVGLSPTPCSRRVKRLEEIGVIAGHFTVLNPEAVGLGVTAFVSVRIRYSPDSIKEFRALLRRLRNVHGCYLLTGADDYLLRVRCKDMHTLSRWIQDELLVLPNVLHTCTMIVLETIKEDYVQNLDELSPEVLEERDSANSQPPQRREERKIRFFHQDESEEHEELSKATQSLQKIPS